MSSQGVPGGVASDQSRSGRSLDDPEPLTVPSYSQQHPSDVSWHPSTNSASAYSTSNSMPTSMVSSRYPTRADHDPRNGHGPLPLEDSSASASASASMPNESLPGSRSAGPSSRMSMSQITRREMSGGEGSENGSPSYGVGVVAAQIVASKKGQYKVEWAGVDPRTGGQRTPSWVPKEQCDEELVDVWRAGRAEREKRKRWVGRALSVGHSERKRKRARGDVLSKSQSDSLSDEYTDPSPSHVRAGPGPNTKRRRTFRSSAPPVSFSNTVLSAAGGQLPLRPSGLFEPFVEIESSVNAPGRRAWSGEPSGIAPDAARPDNIDSEEEEEGDLALSELEGDGDTPGQLEARGPRHRTGPDSGLEGVSYAETSRSSNRHRFDMSVVPDSELSRAAGGLHSQGQISSTNSSGLADVHAVEQSQQQSSIYIAMPPLREPTSGASHAGRMPLQPLAVEAFEPFLDADHGLLLDAAGVPIWDRSTNAGNSSDTSNSRPRRPVEESVHSTHEPSSPVEHFSSPGPPPPQEPPRRKPLARVGGWIVPSPPPREQPLQASSSRLPFPPSEQSIDDALRRTANEETDTHLDHPRAGDAELEIHSFSDVLADPPEPSQNAPNKSQGALTAERGHDAESAPRASTPPLGATARRSGPPLPAPSQTIASEPPSQTRWADAEQETQQSGPSSDNSSLTFSQLAAQPSSRGARRRIITLLHASPWVPSTLKEEVERFVSRARSAAGASGESSITAETEDDSETQEDGLLRTKPTWVLELARTNADGEQVPDRAVAAAAGHAEEGEGEADDLCLVLVLVVSTEEGTFDVQELTEKLVKPLREDPRYSPWHDAAGRRLPKSSLRSSGATSAAAVVGNSGEMETNATSELASAHAELVQEHEDLRAEHSQLRNEFAALESSLDAHRAEVEKAKSGLQAAENDASFMRDLYNKASASAASLATELRESTSLAERLQRQLTEGLQARDAFAARQREKYESEHARLRAQLALLREQAVRTDDMVRQKAAEWDAMEAREAEREREREKRRKAREEEQRRLMAAQEMEEEEADADYIESGFIPALRAAGMVPDAPPSGDVPPPAPAPTGQSSALIREGTIVSGEQSGAIAPSSAALAEAEAAMRAAKASELEAARAEVVHELEAFERAASAGQGEDQDQEEEDMQMQLRMQMQMEMQLQLQQMQNSDLETGTEPTVQAWVSAEPGLQESSSSFEPLTQAQ